MAAAVKVRTRYHWTRRQWRVLLLEVLAAIIVVCYGLGALALLLRPWIQK